jgi:N-acetylglucosaminyldiphosphoundecaprenol N-acetyl-beta-D-mannosaminyltransferase
MLQPPGSAPIDKIGASGQPGVETVDAVNAVDTGLSAPAATGADLAERNLPVPFQARRFDVLGVHISAVNRARALAAIAHWIDRRDRHYVCVTGVHGVMESQRDPELLAIHNASGLTVPDGRPMLWAGQFSGLGEQTGQVRGSDLMLDVCQTAAERGWTSYFYGGKDGVPELLAEKLKARFPGLRVVGTYSPPFRALTPEEDEAIVAEINRLNPDLVWVGLSTPKQERWMAAHRDRIDAPAMFGVGAAFDMHAGLVVKCPPILQRLGLEWLFRLTQEPKRLWKRYLTNNPRFVLGVLRRRPRALALAASPSLPSQGR